MFLENLKLTFDLSCLTKAADQVSFNCSLPYRADSGEAPALI